MIDLKDARYVTALADCQTIRAAAEKLYISSPALSMYIKNLEDKVGSPLFSREKSRFVPTEIGRLHLAYAHQVMRLNEMFEQDLKASIRSSEQRVCIGIYKRRAVNFFIPVLQRLRRSLPHLHIEFAIGSMTELEAMLRQKEADYILVAHPMHKESFSYSYICQDELLMVCSERHLDKAQMIDGCPYPYLPIEELAHQELLMPDVRQSIYAYVVPLLRGSGVQFDTIKTVSNMDIAAQYACADMGICFTLASYIPSFAHIPGIIFCRPVESKTPVSWFLVSLAARAPLPELTEIKEVLRGGMQGLSTV